MLRVRLEGARMVQQEKRFKDLGVRWRDVTVAPDSLIYLLTDAKNRWPLRVRPGP